MNATSLRAIKDQVAGLHVTANRVCETAYRCGLADGLAVAEKTAALLNVRPPRKWAEELRQSMLREIQQLREQHELARLISVRQATPAPDRR